MSRVFGILSDSLPEGNECAPTSTAGFYVGFYVEVQQVGSGLKRARCRDRAAAAIH